MDVFYLLLALALVCSAGFFSSAETAVLAANRMRLRHLASVGNRRAARVLSFAEKPDTFLTSILLGNTVSLVSATALFTIVAERLSGEAVGVAGTTLAMTVLLTLFAEIIPKAVVLEDADYFAMFFAPVVRGVEMVLRPAVWVANVATGGVLGLARVRAEKLPFASREELRAILTTRGRRSRTEVMQRRMIQRIFNFGETRVRQVMVPLTEVVALPHTATQKDVVAAVAESGYSKYPIYEGSPEHLVGALIARDLIAARPETPVTSFVWAPLFVSADESIEALLPRLAARRGDMAVVVGERGEAKGILTQEDIVEEVVGEIEDEYDWGSQGLIRYGNGYTADARVGITYFNQRMPTPLPPGEYVTLGGFLASRLGRIPSSGDEIVWAPYRFRVLRATARAARLVGIEFVDPGEG